jgi:hypothetical protein
MMVHFFGCYGIFMTAQMYTSNLTAFIITVTAGIVWEALDYLNQEFNWRIKQLNPRGADLSDILIDILGAGFACGMVWFHGIIC